MEKIDCIIVGGGLAGLTAAYGLASAGLEVMVVERGTYDGAKNVTGGRLYSSAIAGMYPELWADAPFERPVTRELISLLAPGRCVTIATGAEEFSRPRPQSHTVVRARLDRYLADRATDAGAMVITNMKADALLREGGRVIGIRAGDDEIGADVTVVSEGVLGLLSTEAGLRAKPAARDNALGFKEVIELPESVIEDRWQVGEGEGVAHLFMGTVTRGMMGGAFLYTNRDSVSLGVVVGMDAMRSRRGDLESWQLLDEFKTTAEIAPLVKGGQTAEYSAHAIAEGGIAAMPRLLGDGYLMAGDAAGLSLNAMTTVRGMDFAIASGFHGAGAIVEARKAGDTSAAGLAGYDRRLRASFVMKALQTASEIPDILHNPRLFTHYPDAVTHMMTQIFMVDGDPPGKLSSKVFRGLRRDFLSLATLRDALSFRKV